MLNFFTPIFNQTNSVKKCYNKKNLNEKNIMMRYGRHLQPLNAEIKYVKTVYGGNADNVKRIQRKLSKNK